MEKHVHITIEELESIEKFDPYDILPDQSKILMELYERISGCAICLARYRFYLESEMVLAEMTAIYENMGKMDYEDEIS